MAVESPVSTAVLALVPMLAGGVGTLPGFVGMINATVLLTAVNSVAFLVSAV